MRAIHLHEVDAIKMAECLERCAVFFEKLEELGFVTHDEFLGRTHPRRYAENLRAAVRVELPELPQEVPSAG